MGTWGTGISSNDTYEDVYTEFFELYNAGEKPELISKTLVDSNREIIEDEDDCNNFWFGLIKAQWECKKLDLAIFKKVEYIISSGSDIETWKRLGASNSDLIKRQIVLEKFLDKIKSEKKSTKKRKKIIIKQPTFRKGECLIFKLNNGNFGGAIVLESNKNDEYGHNLIAVTRINQNIKPDKKTFENSELLIINFGYWKEKLAINWYKPLRDKEPEDLIEICCELNIRRDYEVNNSEFGFASDFKTWIIEIIDNQFQFEKENPKPKLKKKLKEYTNKKWWNLD